MQENLTKLTIDFHAGSTADREEQIEEAMRFRQYLSGIDLVKVEPSHREQGPQGAKGDIITFSTLAVTLAPIALKSLLSMLEDWLARRKGDATTIIKIGNETLTIPKTPSKEQRVAIALFLARHGTGEP